ncbi:hypothetical protein AB0O91_28590 [Kitasatospora sp. NPDC089797]|uniref:hypothetical protein n=1 Tax=Kitasatospora sp. NPDC089797 TaxID=3155298 RepID=UPI00341C135E
MPGTSSTPYRMSGSVMTHPKRLDAARRLAADAPAGALSVVVDPDPTGKPSVLRTALAAWSAIGEGATHHLVVQDDMILSESFFERARRAVEAMPDAALALFALWDSRNGAAVRFGALTGARWVAAVGEYFPCVAIILPRDVAAGYVEYAGRHLFGWPDDILMDRYLRAEDVPRFVAVPNLAEHDDQGSISGNAFRGPRRSVCFLPSDRPGDERRQLGGLRVIPFFKYGIARCDVRLPGPGRPRWLHLECEQYLEGEGVPVGRLRSRLPEFGPGIDPQAAWGAWLTAYTMGLVQRRDGLVARSTASTADIDVDPAVLAEALDTLGPGGLSQNGTAAAIDAVREDLAALTRHGLRAGQEDVRAPRRRPAADRRPPDIVGVLGATSPLGEHIVRGLRDHGHHVVDPDAGPAGLSALVDLGPLLPEPAARRVGPDPAPLVLRLSPLGDPLGDPLRDAGRQPAPEVRTVRVGDLYGPGCTRHSPIGRMVWNALRSHPVVLAGDPAAPLHPLHVKDLVRALSLILRDPSRTGPFTLVDKQAVTTRDLAETVHRVVRPVPVELPADSPAVPAPTSAGSAPDGPADWHPEVDLDYGLHSFAQWLAYEGIHLSTED